MRQVALDTETTGLEVERGHRVIEIGCVELLNRRTTGRYFHRYLNPEREIEQGAWSVHGLTRSRLEQEPKFAQIAHELLQFIDGSELIIHNAAFDIGFLEREFALVAPAAPVLVRNLCAVLDTLELARMRHPGQRNSLDALCKRYGIDNSHRDLHGALLDARLLADVYLAMTGGQSLLALEESARERS
jgi:DNA polymerase-3 subunit epsilon